MSRKQAGFSLIELLIAMTITLIISGAIYGLLTSGQNAFRREPAVTDLQQNLRVAVDLVLKDVGNAGSGMGQYVQTFAPNLNGVGIAGVFGNSVATNTDHIQILASDGECPDVQVGPGAYNGEVKLLSLQEVPSCYGDGSVSDSAMLVIHYSSSANTTRWGWAHHLHAADRIIDFLNQPATAETNSQITDPGALANANIFGRLSFVRYEIAVPPDDNMPSLWRSEQAGIDVGGAYQAAPAAAGGWRQVARGIEDMQVQYLANAVGSVWQDDAPLVVAATPGTIIRQVRVTLWARAAGGNLQGQTRLVAGGAVAVREQLSGSSTPRAALKAVEGTGAGFWR